MTSLLLKGKSGDSPILPEAEAGEGISGRLTVTVSFLFPRVTADRPFTNIPTDMIAADTNNTVHIPSASANNALGIITVNTNNYC